MGIEPIHHPEREGNPTNSLEEQHHHHNLFLMRYGTAFSNAFYGREGGRRRSHHDGRAKPKPKARCLPVGVRKWSEKLVNRKGRRKGFNLAGIRWRNA